MGSTSDVEFMRNPMNNIESSGAPGLLISNKQSSNRRRGTPTNLLPNITTPVTTTLIQPTISYPTSMPASLRQTSSRTSQKTTAADPTTNNEPEPKVTTAKSGHAKRGRESEPRTNRRPVALPEAQSLSLRLRLLLLQSENVEPRLR